MLKKLLACLFVLCLTLSCAFAEDDLDSLVMDPWLCNLMDQSAADWYAGQSARALLATGVVLDFPDEERPDMWEEILSAVISNQVYVSTDGSSLFVYFFGNTKTMLAIYTPADGTMLVASLGDRVNVPCTDVMDILQPNGYYLVTGDEISTTMDTVIELLSQ